MKYISLTTIIDDILLLVRNNNISESEDLSRSQIAAWVKAYRKKLWKDRLDELKKLVANTGDDIESLIDLIDDDLLTIKEVGPLALEDVESYDEVPTFTKRTIGTLENIFNNSGSSILAVHDQIGTNIQYMNHIRRHYQYYRKYTGGDLTAYYQDDKHIYIQGLEDQNKLRNIWVKAIYEIDEDDNSDDDSDDVDENDVKIPGWMVPDIKNHILKNELAFMINRPSDDSNNATLASVKPHGPQDQEE